MADAILVEAATQIAAAIEAARADDAFELSDFSVEWDFEFRQNDLELTEETSVCRVIVPTKWDDIDRKTRDSLTWVASFDIDVRRKFRGADYTAGLIGKTTLSQHVRLVEQIHEYFESTLSESRITLASAGLIGEWIPTRDGIKQQSGVLVSYSPKFLRETRQYYGVAREVFEFTVGT